MPRQPGYPIPPLSPNGMASENHSLLSLLLAVSTSKGPSILFSYPAHPKPVPRLNRPIYAPDLDAAIDQSEDVAIPGIAEGESPGLGPGFFTSAASDSHNTYLGVQVDLLAHSLMPKKSALKDAKFELVIDHLAFIGHAVDLFRSKAARQKAAPVQGPPSSAVDARLKSASSAAESPLIIPREPLSHHTQTNSISSLNLSPFLHAKPNDSVSTLNEVPPLLIEDQQSASSLDGFNLVLVVDTPPDKHLSSHLDVYYNDIILKLTAAMKREEHRNEWLSREAKLISEIREKARDQGLSNSDLIARLTGESGMCRDLAHVFDEISEGRIATLPKFANNLNISLILHHELFQTSAAAYALYQEEQIKSPFDAKSPEMLAPWQTLLPLVEPAAMLEELRGNGNPKDAILMQFIELCTPSVNFQEYSTLLDIDMASLKLIVDHLVHWRRAKIINLVNLKNVYKPSLSLSMMQLRTLCGRFSRVFPTLPSLTSILASLSRPIPYLTILPDFTQRALWLDALIWLLKEGVLTECRCFYRIVVSPQIKKLANQRDALRWENENNSASAPIAMPLDSPSALTSPPWGNDQPSGSPATSKKSRDLNRNTPGQTSGISFITQTTTGTNSSDDGPDQTSVIVEPSQPTAREREWLAQIQATKFAPALNWFERMLPFLNGRHDSCEIMFRTNLTRKQIKTVLNDFQEIVSFETVS